MVRAENTSNKAAWLMKPKDESLKLDEAPYPKPKAGQLVIKNVVVAVNAVDWKIQVCKT
jgi:NADPH:quinone reductase-like Zn-dependent oxidoreductase